MSKGRLLVTFGLALVVSILQIGMTDLPGCYAQGAILEAPPELDATQLLKPDVFASPSYRIMNPVPLNGFFYSFTVWSRQGWYHPQSLDMLKIRLSEIRAMAALESMRQDPLFLEGVGEQVQGTVQSTVNVVKHPLKGIANIPLGLEKVGKRMTAQAKEGDVEGTGDTRGLSAQAQRELAFSLGVDPYSDNQQLRDLIKEVAVNKNRGALATRVGTVFIPAAGLALGAAQINKGLTDRLRDMSPAELQEQDRSVLTSIGVPASDIRMFQKNPGYTPTTRTVITEALQGLSSVSGVRDYLSLIQEVPTPEIALFYLRRIQLAERIHIEVRRLTSMRIVGTTPVFTDVDGGTVFAVPVDYLYWNKDLAGRVSALMGKAKFKKVDLYITGIASEMAKAELGKRGIVVHEQMFQN